MDIVKCATVHACIVEYILYWRKCRLRDAYIVDYAHTQCLLANNNETWEYNLRMQNFLQGKAFSILSNDDTNQGILDI